MMPNTDYAPPNKRRPDLIDLSLLEDDPDTEPEESDSPPRFVHPHLQVKAIEKIYSDATAIFKKPKMTYPASSSSTTASVPASSSGAAASVAPAQKVGVRRVYENPWSSHVPIVTHATSGVTNHSRRPGGHQGGKSLLDRLRARAMKKNEYCSDMHVSMHSRNGSGYNKDQHQEDDEEYRYEPISFGEKDEEYASHKFTTSNYREWTSFPKENVWEDDLLGPLIRPSFEDSDEEDDINKKAVKSHRRQGSTLGAILAQYSIPTSKDPSTPDDSIQKVRSYVAKAEQQKAVALQNIGKWKGAEFEDVSLSSMYEAILGLSTGYHLHLNPLHSLKKTQLRYLSEDAYISTFEPLLLEEIKANLSEVFFGDNAKRDVESVASLEISSIADYASPSGFSGLQELSCITNDANIMKDDICALVDRSGKTILKEINAQKHILCIVKKQPLKIYRSDKSSLRSDKFHYEVKILSYASEDAAPGKLYSCVKVDNISTYCREWNSLQSLRNPLLMPLAPYILKGALTSSWKYLRILELKMSGIYDSLKALHQSLVSKASKGKKYSTSEEILPSKVLSEAELERYLEILGKLKNDFDEIVHLLRNCQVDGSVLTKIDIVNLMKEIKDSDIIRATCGSIKLDLQDILKSWKARIKDDNKASVVAGLQGGHIAEVPGVSEVRAQPEHVTADFWKQVLKRYNDSQIWVIKNSCFHDGQDINIHLVQGPPGTGKTHTIMGMISTILSQDNTVIYDASPCTTHQRIILCAPSNAAVDELLRRLTFGILGHDGKWRPCKVVRLGRLAETTSELYEKLLPYTVQHKVDKLIENSELSIKLSGVLEEIRTLLDKLPTVEASADINLRKTKFSKIDQTLRLLKAERARLEHEIELLRVSGTKQVISEAEVVISTLGSSGSYMFTDIVAVDDISFDVAIIDEACQATEPSTLIPLRYGCRKLILVGDPRQLPATVLSKTAEDSGLNVSLFERLEKANHKVFMLNVQYRMHPEIRKFPSDYFYHGRLVDASYVRDMAEFDPKKEILRLADLNPCTFYNICGREEKLGSSFTNAIEIDVIVRLIRRLYDVTCSSMETSNKDLFAEKVGSIAVISPYKGQVHNLRKELAKLPGNISSLIEVNTVDSFQGREKDFVFFSCVRAGHISANRSIGFLSDKRRLNVAITRARHCLVVVGDSLFLSTKDPTWNEFVMCMKTRGCLKYSVHDLEC